jgi:hypothetical protein
MVTRSFTIYKGYRIFLLEEGDFRKDAKGRFAISVHIEKPELENTRHVEVPDCYASSLEEAQQMSVEQAMRIIDGRLEVSGKSKKATPRKKAVKE